MSVKRELICLPVEVKQRDLDPRLYFGLRMLVGGSPFIIGEKSEIDFQVRNGNFSPVYFDKGLSPERDDLYEAVKRKSGLSFSLDEEGGIFSESHKEVLFEKYNQRYFLNGLIDRAFMWGSRQEVSVRERFPQIPDEKLIVTGHPRFDLLKEDRRAYYRELRKKIKGVDIRGAIVFFLSHTFANNQAGLDGLISLERKNLGKAFDEEAIRLRYHYEKILSHYFLELIKMASASFPNMTILVRPAPQENEQTYLQALDGLRNVILSREGSSHEIIANAILSIHHSSTTGVESFIAGVPTLSYRPIFDGNLVQEAALKVSEQYEDAGRLIERVKEVIGSKHVGAMANQKSQSIEGFIHNLTQDDATGAIINIVNQEKVKCGLFGQGAAADNLYTGKRLFLKNAKVNAVRSFRKYLNNKFEGLDGEELDKKISIFVSKLKEFSCLEPQMIQFDANSFLIYPA